MSEINYIVDRLIIPVFSLDKDLTFNYINKKARDFFGYGSAEFIGKKIDEIPSSTLHQFADIYQQAMKEQQKVCLQHYYREEATWLEHHIYPSEDGLTACIIDITEKEKIREQEKINLSREIHDELGQQLTALLMDISALDKYQQNKDGYTQKKIDDITDLLNITVETVRKISTDLHPKVLDNLGLAAALEWQSREFEKRSGITVQFQCHMTNFVFHSNIATCLFRIYQESLTNIARHAEAQMVSAELEWKEDGIFLNITDNGKGFDTEMATLKGRYGLTGMKERALQVGGRCKVNSRPENGTSITVQIPKPSLI